MSRFGIYLNYRELRAGHPEWPKNASGWNGRRVRLRHEIKNGSGIAPEGLELTVDFWGPGRGLVLVADECECCGVRWIVSHVHPTDVELLPQGGE